MLYVCRTAEHASVIGIGGVSLGEIVCPTGDIVCPTGSFRLRRGKPIALSKKFDIIIAFLSA